MADIFHEVDEELRSERMRTAFFKALPWVAGALALALIVALAVWGWDRYRRSVDFKASEAYEAGIEELRSGDEPGALGHFKAAADAGSKGYRALSLIQQAGLKLQDNKAAEGVALLDQAADAAPTPMLGDAARLQAVYALLDSGSKVEVEGRIRDLMQADRPYRAQAREALGLSRLARGDLKGAREEFGVLRQGLDTPEQIRSRAEASMALIDSGVAANVPQILKAARALPPERVEAARVAQAQAQALAQLQAQAQQSQAPQAGTAE